MTHLRLLAPVVIDYASVPGAAHRDAEGYAGLWQRLDATISTVPAVAAGTARVELHHRILERSIHRYSTIDADSLTRPLHVLSISLDATALLGSDPSVPSLAAAVEDATLRCYDHGIALLEIGLDLGPTPAHDVPQWLDRVQAESIDLAQRLARIATQDILDDIVRRARSLDPDAGLIMAPLDRDDPRRDDIGATMWVSRSLLVGAGDVAALDHWTKDVVGGEDLQLRQDLLQGRSDRLVRWLNYAFVDADGEGPAALTDGRFADHWAALRYAQMTYAALDRIDSLLGIVLAEAAATPERWQLELLRHHLVELSSRAEVVILERQHTAKYMKRQVRAYVEEILAGWDYVDLVESPIKYKVDACTRRLDELAARRNARSATVTDLILLGIGVTSIASTALAVIEFGRSSAADPRSTGYDLGGSAFTSWFAAQPIDAVLLISGVVSALLVVLYLYFRRDEH